jgi:sterol desaturase/sphingolipid hydroxylase (fatty acid hydroxylase superfamily)
MKMLDDPGALLLAHEGAIRLGCFLAILAAMALWEALAPRRRQTVSRPWRWANNLALTVLNTLVLRWGFPVLAVGMAALAWERGWGLLGSLALPPWVAFGPAVLALDLAIYLQHVMFHAVPALWRLHRMHHADPEFDVTTGVRFHPLEIVLSMGIKLAVVAALGPPPSAVLVFEVLLNGTALFNHGNGRLPAALDRVLRWVVVTPEMHRVHHSVYRVETDSNFGFNLPWWDRLLGTYRAQPREGHLAMTIGLRRFRQPGDQGLHRLLVQPLWGPASEEPLPYPPGAAYGPDAGDPTTPPAGRQGEQ